MSKSDYLARKQASTRKPNGQFNKAALDAMADGVRDAILKLKSRWYTSPAYYGMSLMNCPRNKHGKRVLRVTNF